jgi:hypothetical protein
MNQHYLVVGAMITAVGLIVGQVAIELIKSNRHAQRIKKLRLQALDEKNAELDLRIRPLNIRKAKLLETHDRSEVPLKIEGVSFRLGHYFECYPRPIRHHKAMENLLIRGRDPRYFEQGFYTNEGNFVDRREAKIIAVAAGQYIGNHNSDDLFSEDLW